MEILFIINIVLWACAIVVILTASMRLKNNTRDIAERFVNLTWDNTVISKEVRTIVIDALRNPQDWTISDNDCEMQSHTPMGFVIVWSANRTENRRWKLQGEDTYNRELTMDEKILLDVAVKTVKGRQNKINSLINKL